MYDTTVEAGRLGIVRVGGQIGEDDSDGDRDSIHAGQGSFWLTARHQPWIEIEEDQASPTLLGGVPVSSG